MDNSFFVYLQQLELMAFFSGYPLIYAIVVSIAGNKQTRIIFKSRIVMLLPFAYALVGTLFLGFQLKKLYPDYSIENIKTIIQQPLFIIWGLLSIFFWIPDIAKKPLFSLLHSFVFFFFLLKDLVIQLFTNTPDKNILKNDMKIYTDSLLLNLGAFALVVIFYFLFSRFINRFRA
jgi:hypothetical protein